MWVTEPLVGIQTVLWPWALPGLCQCRFRMGYRYLYKRLYRALIATFSPAKAVVLPSQAGSTTASHQP